MATAVRPVAGTMLPSGMNPHAPPQQAPAATAADLRGGPATGADAAAGHRAGAARLARPVARRRAPAAVAGRSPRWGGASRWPGGVRDPGRNWPGRHGHRLQGPPGWPGPAGGAEDGARWR